MLFLNEDVKGQFSRLGKNIKSILGVVDMIIDLRFDSTVLIMRVHPINKAPSMKGFSWIVFTADRMTEEECVSLASTISKVFHDENDGRKVLKFVSDQDGKYFALEIKE